MKKSVWVGAVKKLLMKEVRQHWGASEITQRSESIAELSNDRRRCFKMCFRTEDRHARFGRARGGRVDYDARN